jgi:hypothetical protein
MVGEGMRKEFFGALRLGHGWKDGTLAVVARFGNDSSGIWNACWLGNE